MPQSNVTAYISGYLIKKVKENNYCMACVTKWEKVENCSNLMYVYTEGKKFEAGSNLTFPSENFVDFIANCEVLFVSHFDTIKYVKHPRKAFCDIVLKSQIVQGMSCGINSCSAALCYVVELFATVRICHALRDQNQNMNVKGVPKNRKVLKLQHV